MYITITICMFLLLSIFLLKNIEFYQIELKKDIMRISKVFFIILIIQIVLSSIVSIILKFDIDNDYIYDHYKCTLKSENMIVKELKYDKDNKNVEKILTSNGAINIKYPDIVFLNLNTNKNGIDYITMNTYEHKYSLKKEYLKDYLILDNRDIKRNEYSITIPMK